MKKKSKKEPRKFYIVAVRTGKKQNDLIFLPTKAELKKVQKEMNEKDIEWAVML